MGVIISIPQEIRNQQFRRLPYVCHSSGAIIESGVIASKKSILVGVLVYTDGTNNATVTLYDNTSGADGKILNRTVVLGADREGGVMHLLVLASNGIFCQISGTGASAIVYYL